MAQTTHIKICGIRTAEAAEAAIGAGADMVGLVFVDESPRAVPIEDAIEVARQVAGRAEVVGLFKGNSFAEIHECISGVPLSMLQLHGPMTPDHVRELAPIHFLRAVPFRDATFESDLRRWDEFHRHDARMVALIVDTPDPTKIGGGTGKAFDWSALRQVLDEVQPRVPIMLAGGLTPENVAEAIRVVRPWGVDVSSGVESSRGVKDMAKIRAFCQAARNV